MSGIDEIEGVILKKIAVSVLLVALSLSAVFASGNTIKASVVPVGLQISTSSEAGLDPVKSDYGFGAQVSYRRDLGNGLYAEGGIAAGSFSMPEDRPDFSHLLAFAGAGYRYDFTEKISGDVHVDLGADTLFYNLTVSETVTLKAGLDINFLSDEGVWLAVSCEAMFGFSKSDTANYVNYRVIPLFGLGFDF